MLDYIKPNLLASVSDVTLSRALNTWYTNTRDRPTMHIVSTDHQTTNAGDYALATAYEGTGGAGVNVSAVGIDFQAGKNANMRTRHCQTFICPAGRDIRVGSTTGGLGVVNLAIWIEVYL